MRSFTNKTKKQTPERRGFGNYLAETYQHGQQPGSTVYGSRQPVAQAKWQQIADNSPRVAQLKAYQEMSNQGPVIQRYHTDEDTGYLVSGNDRAVLKEDGSKELYLAEEGIAESNTALEARGVKNFELAKQGGMEYKDQNYEKVVPIFKNPEEENKSQTIRKDKIDETESRMDYRSIYNIKCLLTKYTGYSFQDDIDRHEGAMDEKAPWVTQFKKWGAQQEVLKKAIVMLQDIMEDITNEENKDTILSKIMEQLVIVGNAGRDLKQKLMLYCNNDELITKDSLIADIKNRIEGLESEVGDYEKFSFYLPTGCGLFKNYLLEGSKGDDTGKGIGNFHYIDYDNDKSDDAPWNNHFATIIFEDKDNNDSVTLEDAAGQGLEKEKKHWYFKMYGPKGSEESFENKTNTEFKRRKKQQKRLGKLGYPFEQYI